MLNKLKRAHSCVAELDALAAQVESGDFSHVEYMPLLGNHICVRVNYETTKLKLVMKCLPEDIRARADKLDKQIRRSKRDALTSSAKETRQASKWKPNYRQYTSKALELELNNGR
jgi:hypothetical protein